MVLGINSGFRMSVPFCVCSAFRVKAQCDKMRNLVGLMPTIWGEGAGREILYEKLCHKNKNQCYTMTSINYMKISSTK